MNWHRRLAFFYAFAVAMLVVCSVLGEIPHWALLPVPLVIMSVWYHWRVYRKLTRPTQKPPDLKRV